MKRQFINQSRFSIKSYRKFNAFTLIELLVVLVIVGILVLLALPNLTPLITRAKSTEAQLQLEYLHSLQKSHFYMYSEYSSDLSELGFEQEATVEEGGRANYKIEILDANKQGFVAKAVSLVDFDGDGTFNEWEVDEKKNIYESVKD